MYVVLQSIICTVCTQADDSSISAHYLEQGITHLPVGRVQFWEAKQQNKQRRYIQKYSHQLVNHLSLSQQQHCATVNITLTSRRVANVNAVNPHMDVILHVTALLIIIEHKSTISPQVKPISFPPTKYGAFNEKMLWSVGMDRLILRGSIVWYSVPTDLVSKCP